VYADRTLELVEIKVLVDIRSYSFAWSDPYLRDTLGVEIRSEEVMRACSASKAFAERSFKPECCRVRIKKTDRRYGRCTLSYGMFARDIEPKSLASASRFRFCRARIVRTADRVVHAAYT
jgi:hypothetical protein